MKNISETLGTESYRSSWIRTRSWSVVVALGLLISSCASTSPMARSDLKSDVGSAAVENSSDATAKEIEAFFVSLQKTAVLILENQTKTDEKIALLQKQLQSLEARISDLEKRSTDFDH